MTAQESIPVGSTTRNMITYAPTNLPYNPPLVISLHGMGQDAAYQRNQAKWESVADTAKFVVVYPNG
ncbi:MAG: phospholipase, partial [Prevotellaceae bacterium]|nr:phospholipase [Prevotellaceae bacterium]